MSIPPAPLRLVFLDSYNIVLTHRCSLSLFYLPRSCISTTLNPPCSLNILCVFLLRLFAHVSLMLGIPSLSPSLPLKYLFYHGPFSVQSFSHKVFSNQREYVSPLNFTYTLCPKFFLPYSHLYVRLD